MPIWVQLKRYTLFYVFYALFLFWLNFVQNLKSNFDSFASIYAEWLQSIYILCIFHCSSIVLIRCACESNGALWLTLKKLSFIRIWSEAVESVMNICVIQIQIQIKTPIDNHFKLAMARRFFAGLMWDVDNKTALNSDDAATVLMMVEMLRLDFLRDIKLALEQNVVRHAPYSPYWLPPNRPQWSFSTYFVDSRD